MNSPLKVTQQSNMISASISSDFITPEKRTNINNSSSIINNENINNSASTATTTSLTNGGNTQVVSATPELKPKKDSTPSTETRIDTNINMNSTIPTEFSINKPIKQQQQQQLKQTKPTEQQNEIIYDESCDQNQFYQYQPQQPSHPLTSALTPAELAASIFIDQDTTNNNYYYCSDYEAQQAEMLNNPAMVNAAVLPAIPASKNLSSSEKTNQQSCKSEQKKGATPPRKTTAINGKRRHPRSSRGKDAAADEDEGDDENYDEDDDDEYSGPEDEDEFDDDEEDDDDDQDEDDDDEEFSLCKKDKKSRKDSHASSGIPPTGAATGTDSTGKNVNESKKNEDDEDSNESSPAKDKETKKRGKLKKRGIRDLSTQEKWQVFLDYDRIQSYRGVGRIFNMDHSTVKLLLLRINQEYPGERVTHEMFLAGKISQPAPEFKITKKQKLEQLKQSRLEEKLALKQQKLQKQLDQQQKNHHHSTDEKIYIPDANSPNHNIGINNEDADQLFLGNNGDEQENKAQDPSLVKQKRKYRTKKNIAAEAAAAAAAAAALTTLEQGPAEKIEENKIELDENAAFIYEDQQTNKTCNNPIEEFCNPNTLRQINGNLFGDIRPSINGVDIEKPTLSEQKHRQIAGSETIIKEKKKYVRQTKSTTKEPAQKLEEQQDIQSDQFKQEEEEEEEEEQKQQTTKKKGGKRKTVVEQIQKPNENHPEKITEEHAKHISINDARLPNNLKIEFDQIPCESRLLDIDNQNNFNCEINHHISQSSSSSSDHYLNQFNFDANSQFDEQLQNLWRSEKQYFKQASSSNYYGSNNYYAGNSTNPHAHTHNNNNNNNNNAYYNQSPAEPPLDAYYDVSDDFKFSLDHLPPHNPSNHTFFEFDEDDLKLEIC